MIKTLPSRPPELGRLRLGEKVPTKSGKLAPAKLKTFRATSNDELTLRALAAIYGGDVVEWPEGEQAFQVTTETDAIDVLLPADPLFTAFERWSAAGCQRRCDGELCNVPVEGPEGGHLEETDCLCLGEGLTPGDRDDVKKGACTVTVRLKVVIPAVPGLGVWVLTSHSIYAAMELPAQVALLEGMAQRGQLIPATLAADHRTEKKSWEKYERDFIVPSVRVRRSLQQLTELAAGAAPVAAISSGGGAEAGSTGPVSGSRPADESVPTPGVQPAASAAPPASTSESGQFSKAIYTAATKAGIEREKVHAIVAHVTELEKESTKDLNSSEANAVLTVIKAVAAGAKEIHPSGDGWIITERGGTSAEPF